MKSLTVNNTVLNNKTVSTVNTNNIVWTTTSSSVSSVLVIGPKWAKSSVSESATTALNKATGVNQATVLNTILDGDLVNKYCNLNIKSAGPELRSRVKYLIEKTYCLDLIKVELEQSLEKSIGASLKS